MTYRARLTPPPGFARRGPPRQPTSRPVAGRRGPASSRSRPSLLRPLHSQLSASLVVHLVVTSILSSTRTLRSSVRLSCGVPHRSDRVLRGRGCHCRDSLPRCLFFFF